jgi:hypothetical protein
MTENMAERRWLMRESRVVMGKTSAAMKMIKYGGMGMLKVKWVECHPNVTQVLQTSCYSTWLLSVSNSTQSHTTRDSTPELFSENPTISSSFGLCDISRPESI